MGLGFHLNEACFNKSMKGDSYWQYQKQNQLNSYYALDFYSEHKKSIETCIHFMF